MKTLFLSLIFLLVITGCNSQDSGVKITTSGIFTPVLYEFDGKDASVGTIDIGEQLLTSNPQVFTIKVHNSTKFTYTALDLVITANDNQIPSMIFNPTTDGDLRYPGFGGTCGTSLESGKTCEIKVVFSPRDERAYHEILTLKFHNYVDPEIHVLNVKALAGMPAALSFTNDVTQYTFGAIVGTAQVPVVERSEAPSMNQELEVINNGGLSAKNLIVTLTQACSSALTNGCPDEIKNAYSMQSFCPPSLGPKEKCKVMVFYNPKNQDPTSGSPTEEIKEVNYRSTANFSFVKDPAGGMGGLNGYFRSISANIEAKFKVTINNLTFADPVVSGNRDTRSVRVTNLGYREGAIKAFVFKDKNGAHMATCSANASNAILDCFNLSNTKIGLDEFPFTVNDKNRCLNVAPAADKMIDVGNGCIFDFVFQPSVTFLTNKSTEFQDIKTEIVYNSRWRGQQTILNKELFTLSAQSLAAARLIVSKIEWGGVTYPLTGEAPWVADMGKLTLESPLFANHRPLLIQFKNIGKVSAKNISISDAMNRSIPIGGTSVSLGTINPHYFIQAKADDTTCTEIAPDQTCTLPMRFSPIGLNTNAEEDSNMFDAMDSGGVKYKGFRFTYTSGALYTDSNLDQAPDYPAQRSEARLKAVLLRKGLLRPLAEDTRNLSPIPNTYNATGDTMIFHLYIQNMGTGPVPYIRLMNPPGASSNYALIATPDYASLGADMDCFGLIDVSTAPPTTAHPSTRTGFLSLPKEKTCVLSMRFRTRDALKSANTVNCNSDVSTLSAGDELNRFWTTEANSGGGTDLWEYCQSHNGILYSNFSLDYYDGDASVMAGAPYGSRYTLAPYNISLSQRLPGKIILSSFEPFLTATMWRPAFNLPALPTGQAMRSIVEKWFYGVAPGIYFNLNDPSVISPFIEADESRSHVTSLSGYADRFNYDYIYYVGSFPQGSPTVTIPIRWKNVGMASAKVTSYSFDNSAGPNFSAVTLPSTSSPIIAGLTDGPVLTYQLSTTTPGEQQLIFNVAYEPGTHIDPLDYDHISSPIAPNSSALANKHVRNLKILILANVVPTGNYPYLSLQTVNYTVEENDGLPPTETAQPVVNTPLSWNTTAPNPLDALVFDTVKLQAAATPTDVYAKKKLVIRNTTGFNIPRLKFAFRTTSLLSVQKTMPVAFKNITPAGPSACVSDMPLNAGSSCEIIFKYQPGSGDVVEDVVLTFVYAIGTGQYVMQNVGVSLAPKAPGLLVESSTPAKTTVMATVGAGLSRASYPLDFGTVQLDTIPKVQAFDATSSTYKKLFFKNNQLSKASLLLAYQKYLNENNLRGYSTTSKAPSSVIPTAGEYRTHTDGYQYVRVFLRKYSNSDERLIVEASKGCLFGDDENAAISHHLKGFNSATSSANPCYVIATLKMNFEYLATTISHTVIADMLNNAALIEYYSYNRSSTDYFYLHMKGTINPATSIAAYITGSKLYNNVLVGENRQASFQVPKFPSANGPTVGAIVGTRVLMSTVAADLNDTNAYNKSNSFYDIRPYDSSVAQTAVFNGLTSSRYYYFRAVAIRKDTRYTTTTRWNGLLAGEYLSISNNLGSSAPIRVVVPPAGHYYFYNENIVVKKTLNSATGNPEYLKYSEAAAKCTTKLSFTDGGTVKQATYKLITSAAWNALSTTPDATTYYAQLQTVSHWLSDNRVSIPTMCGALPGYSSSAQTQYLNSSKVYYYRNASVPTATVNVAKGGVYNQVDFPGYSSYVDALIPFGSARCMVDVP